MKKAELYVPLWTRLPKDEFKRRFPKPTSPPEYWTISDGVLEFSVDALSGSGLRKLSYRFGGDWSQRFKPKDHELGVKENERVILFSQDECLF